MLFILVKAQFLPSCQRRSVRRLDLAVKFADIPRHGTFSGGPHVPAQLCCYGERSSAVLAKEWSFSSVRAHVIVKRCCARERTSTDAALERSVVAMGYDVVAKFPGLGERFRAMAALVRFVRWLAARVHLKEWPLLKGFQTPIAFPEIAFVMWTDVVVLEYRNGSRGARDWRLVTGSKHEVVVV